MFNYKANIDFPGNQRHSPLNQAVQKKRSDCLEILLSRSAKPTNDGLLSPLMQAIVSGLDMAVQLLLEKGADVNYANSCGKTALYQAIKKNNEKLVAELLDKGASVHYKDSFGSTAIHTAASTGNLNILKTIIDHGADKNALNNKGQNAVFAALGAPPDTFLELLKFFYDDLGLDINQESKEKDTIFTELLPDSKRLTLKTLSFLIQHGADYNKKTKAKGMSIYDIITTTNMFSSEIKNKFIELTEARESAHKPK